MSVVEVVLDARVSTGVEVPTIVTSERLDVTDESTAVGVDVAGSVKSKTLELGSAEISERMDDTGTDTTIVELVGTGISVISDNIEVSTDVGRIVISIALELGCADISDKRDETGTGITTAVEVEAITTELVSTKAEVADVSEDVSDTELSSELVVVAAETSVEVGRTEISIRLDVCVGSRRSEVTIAKLDVEMMGISKVVEVAGKVAGNVLETGSTVSSTELDAEVTTTASDVTGMLEVGTIVMSSRLEVGVGTSISEVTLVNRSEVAERTLVARGRSAVVVAAMLDKALASEDAAEAASPDVTTVAALLRMDCRLEI